MELDPEDVKRLGLDPGGPKAARELSSAEMKLMGLPAEGPDQGGEAWLNTSRIAGTAGVQGVTDTLNIPSSVVGLAGPIAGLQQGAADWFRRQVGLPPRPESFVKGLVERERKAGNAISNFLNVKPLVESVGLPTDAAAEANRLGAEMTPLRKALASGVRTATGSAMLGAGRVGSALAGAGAGIGQTVGGDTGELVGALAAPLAAPAIANRVAASAARPPATSAILGEADDAFNAVKIADAAVTQKSFGGLAAKIEQKLRAEPILDKQLQPKTLAIFEKIKEKAADPNIQGQTMNELWGIRRVINKAIPKADLDDMRLLKSMKTDLDQYMFGVKNKADALYGDVERAGAHLKEGITKYAQGQAAKELEGMIEKAAVTSKGWQAPSLDRALRTEFKKVVNNPDELRRFPKAAQDAMKLVVNGTPLRNALRFVGKFSPVNVIPGLAFGTAAASGEDDWALPLAALAGLSRAGSNRMGAAAARRAVEAVRRGGPAASSLRRYLNAAPAVGAALTSQSAQ